MGCALLGLSAVGSGFLGAHMTASIGGADMPVASKDFTTKKTLHTVCSTVAHRRHERSDVVFSGAVSGYFFFERAKAKQEYLVCELPF